MFQIFFIFTPIWGRIPILTNIFQMGWFNHQPVDEHLAIRQLGPRWWQWQLKTFFDVQPYPREVIQFDYFSKELVQPPTCRQAIFSGNSE